MASGRARPVLLDMTESVGRSTTELPDSQTLSRLGLRSVFQHLGLKRPVSLRPSGFATRRSPKPAGKVHPIVKVGMFGTTMLTVHRSLAPFPFLFSETDPFAPYPDPRRAKPSSIDDRRWRGRSETARLVLSACLRRNRGARIRCSARRSAISRIDQRRP